MPCSPGMRSCRPSCLHRALVTEYRDARHAWEALRESGQVVVGVPGGGGAVVSAFQCSDVEFAAAHPPPLFKAWLIGHAGRRRDPST